MILCFFFFFKQKTAYEMRISDWSSDVCSSDLGERQVAGGDALGQRHQVRLDGEAVAAEPLAGAPEAADHLVGDQQDVVLPADALHLRPIACRRDDDAAGTLHRLAAEGGDGLRPELEDLVLARLGGGPAEPFWAKFLRRGAAALPVPVGLADRKSTPLNS